MPLASKLPVENLGADLTAVDLAELIFGRGARVTDATFTGDSRAAGSYSDGNAVSPGVTPGDTGIILSTGLASDFTNASGEANQAVNTSTDTSGIDGDPILDGLALAQTFDAATLDIDFIPDHARLTMDFVFSSEEYQEFENSVFQDFVAVWINGTRVTMDVGNGDIDPGNINTTNNINMFVDNGFDDANTEMDGFTLTLSLSMNVVPDQVNSLRIAIADVTDSAYDSSLLVAADAVQAEVVAETDSVLLNPNTTVELDVLNNDINFGPGTLFITHINGQAVVAGDIVTLPTGQSVQLNPDATLSIVGDDDIEDFNFTYTASNGLASDVGLVNAMSVPCFVTGTPIATPFGERSVEDLKPGDLVLTRDNGPQPLRWIGTRTVRGKGKFAPICIAAEAFGTQADIFVSPLHRILISDPWIDPLFGTDEALSSAKDLVDGRGIRICPRKEVTYVHLLFDTHQIVTSSGLDTESYLPGPQTKTSFEADLIDEILALFPQIDPDLGTGYAPAARRILKRYEADVLRQMRAA